MLLYLEYWRIDIVITVSKWLEQRSELLMEEWKDESACECMCERVYVWTSVCVCVSEYL